MPTCARCPHPDTNMLCMSSQHGRQGIFYVCYHFYNADKRRVRSVYHPLFSLIALTLPLTSQNCTYTNQYMPHLLPTNTTNASAPTRQRVPNAHVAQHEIPCRLNQGLLRPAVSTADAPTEAYTNTHQCPPDAHAPHATDTLTRAHATRA